MTSTSASSETDKDTKGSSYLSISPSWDAFATEYEKRVEPFTSKFADEMLRPLLNGTIDGKKNNKSYNGTAPKDYRPRTKLLDVGCGTGAAALLALSHGLDVVVTDVSEAMVERTKERAFAAIMAGNTAIAHRLQSQHEALSQSVVARGQDLPSSWSDSFDLAVANFSVIFFPLPVLGLREILRCLVPGTGIVAFTAWGDVSETPAFRVFPDVISEVLPELVETGRLKRITGSVEVLTKLMKDAGFVDFRVEGPVFKTLAVKSPSEYYDRFALSSPPIAELIAKMDAKKRSEFRTCVTKVAKARGGQGDGSIALISGAYIAYGRKPAST